MSEPSDEAKQAAGKWLMEGNTNVATHQAYCAGYDAATAKLRAQLDQAKCWLKDEGFSERQIVQRLK